MFFSRVSPRISVTIVAGVVAGLSCSNPAGPGPTTERLESFSVSAPAVVAAGQSVSVTVEAVGSEGTRPFAFTGVVILSADRGTITPDTLDVAGGTARTAITLSAADGAVRITAAHATARGSAFLSISALTTIPGAPGERAGPRIPDLSYLPTVADFDTTHPNLVGTGVARSIMLVSVEPDATVGQINGAVAGEQALIIGGFPSAASGRGGLLMLRIPDTSHQNMDSALARIRAMPGIRGASPDILDETLIVPAPNSSQVPDPLLWLWSYTPMGDNWGMEMIRAPQMWNLTTSLRIRPSSVIRTGILDDGYDTQHVDLSFGTVTGAPVMRHGTHVAGIIAGRHNNGKGVDGVTPFADLHVEALPSLSWGAQQDATRRLAMRGCRVINTSIGRKWAQNDSPQTNTSLRLLIETVGAQIVDMMEGLNEDGHFPLLVHAAGNDGRRPAPIEARYNSPFCYAGMELGRDDILVVEALELDGTTARRAAFTNISGHVSAPGSAIMSTVLGSLYGKENGTSMAAPHVTGLASYLLSIDPTLTVIELKELLMSNARPASDNNGFPASNMVDAFASAMDIDRLRGNNTVLRMLLDVDDGSEDGNLRVDGNGTDVTSRDLDGNLTLGDGAIDMSDFRAWRDAMLLASGINNLVMDGGIAHIKRDLNLNGVVEDPLLEAQVSRFDFNGDGTLDPIAAASVPGAMASAGPVTDLDMLRAVFNDPHVHPGDLPPLVYSGDLHVDLSAWTANSRFTAVASRVDVVPRTPLYIAQRFHDSTNPSRVYSLYFDDVYSVTALGMDASGDTLCTKSIEFFLEPGEDIHWAPECPGLVVEITMAVQIEQGSSSPLLIRAGDDTPNGIVYRDGINLAIQAVGGSVSASTGVTDSDGFFSTSVTLGASSQLLVVSVTASDPASGATVIASASATPLPDAGVRVTLASAVGAANASAGSGEVIDNQIDSQGGDFTDLTTLNFSAAAAATVASGLSSASSNASASLQGSVVWTAPGIIGSIIASGTANVSGTASSPVPTSTSSHAGGLARIHLRFIVAEPVHLNVSGSLGAGSGGTGATLSHSTLGTLWSHRDGVFDEDLAPGTYLLTMDGGASGITRLSQDETSFAAGGNVSMQARFSRAENPLPPPPPDHPLW